MFGLLLLLQATGGDVVVTGKRLAEAHAVCVKGGCTPLRDAQASIAMAEALFRGGDYVEAKSLLAAAIDRNKKRAPEAPKPVAALYEAYATVSLHEGDQREFRNGVVGQVRIMRQYVSAADPDQVGAEMALGDMWIQLRRYDQAVITFGGVVHTAERIDRPELAMLASMRLVWLAAALGDRAKAKRLLASLENAPLSANSSFRTALDVLKLRIAARGGSAEEIDALVKRLGPTAGDVPTLIYAPPYEASAFRQSIAAQAFRFGERSTVRPDSTDYETLGWIDVGFYIRPDGTTADIEALRTSKVKPEWTSLVLNQVAHRRYGATAVAAGQVGLGIYRVERVTRSTIYFAPTGSFIRRRMAADGFRVLDLTEGSTPPG